MTLKNDEQFEKELACCFKIDMTCCFRIEMSELKNTEELCLMALKIDAKFEGKLICAFKNDMRNLANFHQSTRKPQNWDFDEILLSKKENV